MRIHYVLFPLPAHLCLAPLTFQPCYAVSTWTPSATPLPPAHTVLFFNICALAGQVRWQCCKKGKRKFTYKTLMPTPRRTHTQTHKHTPTHTLSEKNPKTEGTVKTCALLQKLHQIQANHTLICILQQQRERGGNSFLLGTHKKRNQGALSSKRRHDIDEWRPPRCNLLAATPQLVIMLMRRKTLWK